MFLATKIIELAGLFLDLALPVDETLGFSSVVFPWS